jgi:hypothetical protein
MKKEKSKQKKNTKEKRKERLKKTGLECSENQKKKRRHWTGPLNDRGHKQDTH